MNEHVDGVQASVPAPRGSDELREIPGYWSLIDEKVAALGPLSAEQRDLIVALLSES